MHIAIDARALSWAGIGTYTRNLLQQFALLAGKETFTVSLAKKDMPLFKTIVPAAHQARFTLQIVEASYYSWREQIIFLRQLLRIPADLFHFTNFNLPVLFPRPYVVTIHDITRFIFPGQKTQALRRQLSYEIVFRRAVERARAVIAVSKATGQDLRSLPLRRLPPVRIIYEGVEDLFHRPVSPKLRQRLRMLLGTNAPYFLYVGVWMNHKNIFRILEAFAQLQRTFPTHRLVLTGKPRPGYSKVLEMARRLGIIDQLIFAGFVPAQLLPALYAEAAVFLFPSLYEGFGLPALEAAACGTPAVVSNVTSLPELLGTAARYVNPEHVPGIVQAATDILTDSQLRIELTARGRMHARQYRWSDAAQQHLALYRSIAGNNRSGKK